MRYSQSNPILYGPGEIKSLGPEAKAMGCTKVLLISGPTAPKRDAYKAGLKSLRDSGIDVVEFNEIPGDPPDYIIDKGGELAVRENVDGIVAIGGGSPMDAAKGINILLKNPPPINNYFGKSFTPYVPIILVPTTAGTASEVNAICVVTDTKQHLKRSVRCSATLGILDPELTLSMPPSTTATTAMDAFSHAAESITSKNWNPKSELLATKALSLIVANCRKAMDNPDDIEARSNLLLAANYAGIAFSSSMLHLGHGIAHSLGAKLHVVHGIGCALQIPEVMQFMANVKPDKVRVVGEAIGVQFDGTETPEQIGDMVAKAIRAFNRSVEIPSLASLGFSREEAVSCAELVPDDPVMNFIPVKITVPEIEKVIRAMYDNN